MNSIFAIHNKDTSRFESFGSKCAWLSTSAAKNAWLMRCEAILESLSKHGGHNWDGYEEAMQEFRLEWKK